MLVYRPNFVIIGEKFLKSALSEANATSPGGLAVMLKYLSLLCYLLWVTSCGDIAPYSEHDWNLGCGLLVPSASQITTSATHEHMLIKCFTNHHLCYRLTHVYKMKATHLDSVRSER